MRSAGYFLDQAGEGRPAIQRTGDSGSQVLKRQKPGFKPVFLFLNNFSDNVQIIGNGRTGRALGHEKKFSCRGPRVYTGRNRTERKGWQMKRWWFGLGLTTMMCLGACARGGSLAGDTLSVGQRQEDLVARKGQPQEIQPGPGGGKTYIYTTSNLDQTAIMGGGAWVKPDQVYYHINDQGVITEVQRYPYGKRSFIFPSKEKPVPTAPVQVAATPGPAPQAAPPTPACSIGGAPGPGAAAGADRPGYPRRGRQAGTGHDQGRGAPAARSAGAHGRLPAGRQGHHCLVLPAGGPPGPSAHSPGVRGGAPRRLGGKLLPAPVRGGAGSASLKRPYCFPSLNMMGSRTRMLTSGASRLSPMPTTKSRAMRGGMT